MAKMLKVKDDTVNIWGLQPEMQVVLQTASQLWSQHGSELVVTCARDGLHSPGSMHYYGYAVDLRTWDFSDPMKRKVADLLQGRLAQHSPYYDVVLHDTHIHVEFDWPRSKQRG